MGIQTRWVNWCGTQILVEIPKDVTPCRETIAKAKLWYVENEEIYPVSFLDQDEFLNFVDHAVRLFKQPIDNFYGGLN